MRIPISVFLLLFTLSGFAGLIYESIWSHYLKLFLGHAAYAQTLVLALFMGGMAVGSGLAGRFADRIRQALLGYALAELVIGIMALSFHATFNALTSWAFDVLIPGLGSPAQVEAAKWLIATALILPPSILLGTTFPLMSSGIMRRYSDTGGRSLPALYFTNSLGAAIGVLVSGFVLVEKVGLPGAIFAAGLVNILLACAVWLLARGVHKPAGQQTFSQASSSGSGGFARIFYVAAFITGAASFAFEISWIRMLTLAVGASTHSFEVMLSAFILGIALGGLVLSLTQSRIGDPARALAWVVVVKCFLAVSAVMLYPLLLDLVRWLHQGLGRTAQGYTLFVLSSYGVSMLMMVPTALCAGMTLPLITRALLARGSGESAVGGIYAANTLGAIAGTVLATHAGLELLGVQGLTGMAALAEAGLAIILLAKTRTGFNGLVWPCAALMTTFLFYGFGFTLDPLKMASGVYRDGLFFTSDSARVLSHHDGKTATISVVESSGTLSIRTNGKSDASLNMDPGMAPTADEHTMVMAAILPVMHQPDAKLVANIGFGSGLTTHTLLGHPGITRVDSIEIERAMLEGAKLFGQRNALAYTDSRSNLYVEDAKTYFASRPTRYDIIISEPSNPWVSGVATLFSEEFYGRIRTHLKEDGLFVQWIQLYETNPDIVASIMKALGRRFADYTIYHSAGGDAIILAKPSGRLDRPAWDPFVIPEWRSTLNRLGYQSVGELELLRVAGKRTLQPLFESFSVRPNSDFFPYVDLQAPRERFMGSSAIELVATTRQGAPLAALLEGERLPGVSPVVATVVRGGEGHQQRLGEARATLAGLTPDLALPDFVVGGLRDKLVLVRAGIAVCPQGLVSEWLAALESVITHLSGTLESGAITEALDTIQRSACGKALRGSDLLRFSFLQAVAARNVAGILQNADALIRERVNLPVQVRERAWQAAVAARLAGERAGEAPAVLAEAGRAREWPQGIAALLLQSHVLLLQRSLPATSRPGGS